MDHQSKGLNEGLRDHSNNVDYWSKGLNSKGRGDQSGHTTHQSRELDRGLRVYSGQTDHHSSRLNENPEGQYGQVDCRSTGPNKGSKCYNDVSAHRSTRQDNSSGEHLGQQDQQNNITSNPKFSSHRGLNREISTDSQTSDQDCDRTHRKLFIFWELTQRTDCIWLEQQSPNPNIKWFQRILLLSEFYYNLHTSTIHHELFSLAKTSLEIVGFSRCSVTGSDSTLSCVNVFDFVIFALRSIVLLVRIIFNVRSDCARTVDL